MECTARNDWSKYEKMFIQDKVKKSETLNLTENLNVCVTTYLICEEAHTTIGCGARKG